MSLVRLSLCAAVLTTSAWAQTPPHAAPESVAEATAPTEPASSIAPAFVAVIIGLNSYEFLPDAAELNSARSDAFIVADALKKLGNYQHTFLLTDRDASRDRIRETIRTEVAQLTGPRDTLLVYFVGHGLGADLGIPTLLAHDSTLENGQEDGFEVGAFATDIATWTRVGRTILVTDAIHRNQLDGIPFFGPAADQWPGIGPNTLVISSSGAGQVSKDGLFGGIFADAVSGGADADSDTRVTARELSTYLDARMAGSGQAPVFAGTYGEDLVISAGVTPGRTFTESAGGGSVLDYDIYAAKFVFREGVSPTITCLNSDTKACDPSCYVRNFRAGPCVVKAVFDGTELRGKVFVDQAGGYDCGLLTGERLTCRPVKKPQSTTP